MKKSLRMAVATAALVFAASGAVALDDPMYVTGSGESRMVMGGMAEGAPLMMGENGAAPGNCPEGSYYEINEQVFACGDDKAGFTMSAPGEGMMMSNGEAYPQGSMLMTPSGGDVSPGGGTTEPAPKQ